MFSAGNIYHVSYLTQTLATITGRSYTLSYNLLDAGNLTGGPWSAEVNSIYFAASVSVDNTPIGDIISKTYPTVDTGFGWKLISSTFIATSGSTVLTFTTSQPPNYFYLTNISVTTTCV